MVKKLYQMAGLVFSAEFESEYLNRLLENYEADGNPELMLKLSEEDVRKERAKNQCDINLPDAYLESLAFYRKFATEALSKDVLLLHGSAIGFNGRAYIYTAPSGTGKSTHTSLCMEEFGNRVFYINDDKPMLRKTPEGFFVYGTPFDGKHHRSTNCSMPLGGICILRRGAANSIRRLTKEEALKPLLLQIFRPATASELSKMMELSLSLLDMPLYELHCNITKEAARLSLSTMAAENQ